MNNSFSGVLRWSARISAVLLASLYLFFASGEIFTPHAGAPRGWEWVGILLVSAACLTPLLAWRWEVMGAVISMGCLIGFVLIADLREPLVLGVIALPAILFLADHFSRAGFKVHA